MSSWPRRRGSTNYGLPLAATEDLTSTIVLAEKKATLQEALALNESLAEHISAKLARTDAFRTKLRSDAQRCRSC